MTKFKKTFIKIAVSFFTALFFLFQSPSPILATAVTDTYTDTTKVNTSASSNYAVSGGQAKILSLGGNAGWWKMDEASGNTAADSSGNGNTGTASPFASGGTITSSGGYTIHTFTATGTFTPYGSMNVESLVVGGGGGTGSAYQGSGGGGGGVVDNSSYAVTATPYTVTVGAGGSGSAVGSQTQANGGDSIFGNMTAYGGGRGGSEGVARSNGGSGGGGSHNADYSGGTATQGLNGTTRYGNSGGTVTGNNQSPWNAAGGGGAGAVGQTVAVNGATPGAGGIGISSSISGSAVYYGGGGAGSNRTSATNSGGTGGGGATGVAGTANTGGGGGAGSHVSSPTRIGGAGGSGIVIIRYPSATYYGTTIVAGQYGNARSFNGTSDYISADDSSSLDIGTKLTITGWFKVTDTATNRAIISKVQEYLVRFDSDDTFSFFLWDGVDYEPRLTATVNPSPDVWHHFAAVYDNTLGSNQMKLYIDGTLNSQQNRVITPAATTNNLQIGRFSSSDYFSGSLDDIRMYNYARTDTQIANDKNNTNYEPSATIQSTNLLSGEASIISSIDNFVYNLSSKPTGTTATIQFSQDASSWYNSSGTLNGTDTLTTGANNTISLASLGWDTANFYYKIAFGGDGSNSPVLDDITLNYTTTGTCTTPPAGGGNYTVSSNCAFTPTSETSIVRDLGSTPGHGTITGTSAVPGKYGTARKFNGTSDYIDISNQTSFNFERTNTFSVSFWLKTTGSANAVLVSKMQSSGNSTGWEIVQPAADPSKVQVNLINTVSTNEARKRSSISVNTGAWTHVAFTYDGTSSANGIKIYINGALDSSATNITDILSGTIQNSIDLNIGARNGTVFFNGQIDDVRIYNYARSADQIKDDMNETPMTTNLPVGWWKMDDGYIGGVDNGDITVATGVTLTVNSGQTLVWNPGKSIIIATGGSIALNVNSRLKQAYLYVTDVDGDNYQSSDSKLRWADVAPGNGSRWYLAGATSDCNDANVNIYQNLSTVAADTDQDGYTVSAPSTECVGSSTTISSRTYYKDSAGTYTWLLDSQKLGTSDCDGADSSVAVTRTQRLNADGDSYTVAGSSFCASPSTWGNSACSTAGSDYAKNSAASCLLVGVLGGDDCSDANAGPNRCCWERPSGTCNSNCNVTGCSTQQTSRFCQPGCSFETVTCYGNQSDCPCTAGAGTCEERSSSFTRYNTCLGPGCTLSNSSTCWQNILSCTWSW